MFVDCQALELEPGSTFYQTSLSQVEEKIRQTQPGGEARPAPGGGLTFHAKTLCDGDGVIIMQGAKKVSFTACHSGKL